MKKIGIVTFHSNYNFGAALQCAAVCELVRKHGGDPRVVDYSPYDPKKTLLRGWKFRALGIKQAVRKRFIDGLHGREAAKNFTRFRNHYWKTTDHCQTNQEIANATRDFSHLITGSDQVWRFDRPSPYFLEWGAPKKQAKISYAPCCTGPDQPNWQIDRVATWIKDIDHLSVRNDFSRDVVKALTGRTPSVVADPTLLVDFKNNLRLPEGLPESYILVYVLGSDPKRDIVGLVNRAKLIHPKSKIIAVSPTFLSAPHYPWADLVLYGLGPFEWAALIRSSELLITDSFHGILFGLKYGRPVIGYHKEVLRAPRLQDLAGRYALENQIVSSNSKLSELVFTQKPSDETEQRIDAHRNYSEGFLKTALLEIQ